MSRTKNALPFTAGRTIKTVDFFKHNPPVDGCHAALEISFKDGSMLDIGFETDEIVTVVFYKNWNDEKGKEVRL